MNYVLQRIFAINLRYKYMGFFLSFLLAIVGIWGGTDLPIKLSLADLLPDSRQSVIDLHAVEKEVGGVGYLIVLLGPMSHPEKKLPLVSKKLQEIPEIKYSFFEKQEYSLRDYTLYLFSKKELQKITKNSGILFGQNPTRGLDLGLSDEESIEDEKQEAKRYFSQLSEEHLNNRYYISNDGAYAMVLAKPTFDSEDLKKSADLVNKVEDTLNASLPNSVPFTLVGRYVDKVNDTKQINYDIYRTSIISFIAIAFVLIWGLGALRATLVTIAGVFLSMGWTVGIAKITIGQINILTGFLLAILSGLGVEYGIHLIRRYYQERAMGIDHKQAVETAYFQMGRSLFSAAVTSSAAFFILSFSDFRGFSELGVIAGFGILSIYSVYILCFPFISDFLRNQPRFSRSLEWFGFYPFHSRWLWIVIPTVFLSAIGLTRAEFEYNFDRMHDLSKKTQELNQLASNLFGKSLTPAALLASNSSQAKELEEWLEESTRENVIQDVISLHSLMPQPGDYHYDKIEQLRKAIQNIPDKTLKENLSIDPKQIHQWLTARAPVKTDLPLHVRENFGRSENIVLTYPKENLDYADSLRRFANVLEQARAEFPGVKIGSDALVFVEILDHIVKDGKIVLLLFLVGAFFVFWLDFRNVYDALILELQLVAGIIFLVALMGLFGVRFSILNIAMLPAVLAAGIDIGVHVRHREKEGFRALASARFVAQAVQLSAITTIIGFGSLFFAEAGMLKGIAWISVLGQLSMYLICMVFFPMLKDMVWRIQKKAEWESSSA